jgi:phage nucleotide-binding protein
VTTDQAVANEFGLVVKKPTRDPKKIAVKMNIFGGSGVGKTRLAAQIARHFKTFMIFSERSEATFPYHPDIDVIEQNLDIAEVSSWSDVQKAYDFITAKQDEYQWVITDSVTDINKRIIEDIQSTSKDEVMSQRLWGQVTSRLEKLIRYIRDLRTNILFISLATGDKNDETGGTKQYPSLTGRLKEEFGAYLDINGYMYTISDKNAPNGVARYIQFINTPAANCKDRFDKLTYEPPDMTQIFRKLGIVD